jgi:hypothetical protein
VVVNKKPGHSHLAFLFLSHLCGGELQFETLIYWVVHHHIGGLEIFEATANNQ